MERLQEINNRFGARANEDHPPPILKGIEEVEKERLHASTTLRRVASQEGVRCQTPQILFVLPLHK